MSAVKKKNVLIIDDDAIFRKTLVQLLHLKNLQIYEASSGKEGLQKLGDNLIDCVISDLIMPHMNGVTFVKEARKFYQGPIILISGEADRSFINELVHHGISAFIDKVNLEGLSATLNDVLVYQELSEQKANHVSEIFHLMDEIKEE